ncbi:hypothetical protein RUM43_002101 [Polyplax serrata]|uniref:SEC7 domain-containing protein n=1 Tax=Polyplax serrata TaxID=468196 RepID=A0AAN8NST4_POLSC
MAILLAAMRRGNRWSSHSVQNLNQDVLIRSFNDLKDVLNQIGDLKDLDPNHYFDPFLEVIRAGEITGPITGLAISSVHKFLSYGLIEPTCKSVPGTLQNITNAVINAKFVSIDETSDGVVLMRVLQLLRTLVLSPIGPMLTNDSMRNLMLYCFQICLDRNLTEHLRKSAEFCLKDLVQHLFSQLSELTDDARQSNHFKRFRMSKGSVESAGSTQRKRKSSTNQSKITKEPIYIQKTKADNEISNAIDSQCKVEDKTLERKNEGGEKKDGQVDVQSQSSEVLEMASGETNNEIVGNTLNSKDFSENEASFVINVDISDGCPPEGDATTPALESSVQPKTVEDPVDSAEPEEGVVRDNINNPSSDERAVVQEEEEKPETINQDYVNPQGVRFTSEISELEDESQGKLLPYGLECIHELLKVLISLCDPSNKRNNEVTIHLGLTLLGVAFEIGADEIGKHESLLAIVKDELCRNLFSLLYVERISIFTLDIQVLFLIFESLRTHLKFQLEFYLTKLTEMIVSDSPKISYDLKEIALESVVQLWRIPGLVTELYLNYDCDLYCPNLFEDLTKLLSKNAFPIEDVYNTHLLSLAALLTIIDSIECHCHNRILYERQTELESNSTTFSAACNVRMGRQKISENIPSHEELMAVKRKKKLLTSGTEQFNTKPKKGVQFLQEHCLLSTPLDPQEVVHFLRENPRLDKKMIGDFISNRSNLEVLDAFVKSFDFSDLRIDEALRLYLETFRLPGESPLISLIMEHFADHWHKCNGEPFVNADAAFTLAYAVIMLNVDQHNHNVKRQNNPMTAEEFKKNLKKVNGGQDFDQDMLDEIYNAIKNEEIVMPAEQTGIVKENYLWKVLLRRGASKDGIYLLAPNGLYDHDLFSLIWGPSIGALSCLFDKSNDVTIYQKAVLGFRKCATISAHYSMSNDFDNLIVSLCKFTNLTNSTDSPDSVTISFGANPKAQIVTKTLFDLLHKHGDIMRESWKNILDIILQLHRCKLLPKSLIEADDFLEHNKKIILKREEIPSQKTETGLLSSLYSYIALGAEASSHRTPSLEDQEHMKVARHCIKECKIEQIITESRFLRIDSLQGLLKSLIASSHGPGSNLFDEDATVFFLEILVKIVIQNSDRANEVWSGVRDHIYSLIMGASACDHYYLTERSVVGLLRLAIRLMRREEMSLVVLQSLSMLLLLKTNILQRISRQIAYGLYELLKTSAANIHTSTDWTIIFTLLECVGAGAPPPRLVGNNTQGNTDQGAKSDGDLGSGNEDSGLGNDRGYTSDSEVQLRQKASKEVREPASPEVSPNIGGGWILVGPEGDIQPIPRRGSQNNVAFENELLFHDPFALVKCCESLAFLVRDVAHITPFNFEYCIHCIRTFVEASLNGTEKKRNRKPSQNKDPKSRKKWTKKKEDKARSQQLSPTSAYDADESDSEEFPSGYHQISIQLLDLMHTLHTRTAQIFRWWAEENADTNFTSLWSQGWCPLLQGIARLCCDSRKQVRMSAITYLQRALLVHDLQTLTADEWESCFNRVLFPLLEKLLELNFADEPHLEETRVRAATVLSKVFLHHLTPLLSLPTFTTLWLNILDFMNKYMHVEKSDLLFEAIPESLKNMLLVMDSAQVFTSPDGYLPLWHVTWDRINGFLPGLKEEFFKAQSAVPKVDDIAVPATKIDDTSAPPAVLPSGSPHIIPEPVKSSSLIQPPLSNHQSTTPRGTSIILQPPSPYGHTFTTPILNHLGQQLMTTTISGQLPTSSVSLVPTMSQTQEQKVPLLVPVASVISVPADLASSKETFTSISKDIEVSERPTPASQDSRGLEDQAQVDAKSVTKPQPITPAYCSPPPAPPSPPIVPKPEETPSGIPTFGSRTSAFVPYISLNNHMPVHSYPSSSSSELLYIPPTSHITAPVQMYSTPRFDQDVQKIEPRTTRTENSSAESSVSSVLSQYFSQKSEQPDAFDSLISSSCVQKQSDEKS